MKKPSAVSLGLVAWSLWALVGCGRQTTRETADTDQIGPVPIHLDTTKQTTIKPPDQYSKSDFYPVSGDTLFVDVYPLDLSQRLFPDFVDFVVKKAKKSTISKYQLSVQRRSYITEFIMMSNENKKIFATDTIYTFSSPGCYLSIRRFDKQYRDTNVMFYREEGARQSVEGQPEFRLDSLVMNANCFESPVNAEMSIPECVNFINNERVDLYDVNYSKINYIVTKFIVDASYYFSFEFKEGRLFRVRVHRISSY